MLACVEPTAHAMSFDAERRALLAQAEIDKEAALTAFEAQAQQQVRRSQCHWH